MFTGIIDHCGEITAISCKNQSIQLSIAMCFQDLVLGESICVDGVCLTVTEIHDDRFRCDLSPETVQLTNAKHYSQGDAVNLERSMRLSDRMGGHIVTGHVDGVITIQKIEKHGEFVLCEFTDIQEHHHRFLTVKGSVCINGVSLTINTVEPDYFSVMLIPHTLQITHLDQLKAGDHVNVEYDYLAKLVQRQLVGK